MDDNKLEKYKEIDYTISKVCGDCIHGRFSTHAIWGTCSKYAYEHLKHTTADRQLSIHKYGTCPSAEILPTFVDTLGKYSILIENTK